MVGYLDGSGRRVRLLGLLCCRAESRSEIARLGGDGMGVPFWFPTEPFLKSFGLTFLGGKGCG